MKIAYFDCFSGASGDMLLGALVDSGLSLPSLQKELSKLSLRSWNISAKSVKKGAISSTKVTISVKNLKSKHSHTTLKEIISIIKHSKLTEDVKKNAVNIFMKLAYAEGKVHKVNPLNVEFHEVGAIDSIIDIVGTCIGIELLGIEKIYSSRLPITCGSINTEHGTLPVPAPATLELLRNYPVYYLDTQEELVTPTGAAILVTLTEEMGTFLEMTIESIGYGAGSKDLGERPNCLRVVIGETIGKNFDDVVWVLETNLDNTSGEVIGYLYDKLFEAGAFDIYTTPIQMKKSRPAVLLSVITPSMNIKKIEKIIFRETSTFGIRRYPVERTKLERNVITVKTKYGNIRLKIGRFDGKIIKAIPEYEDLKIVAGKSGLPLTKLAKLSLEQLKRNKI